MSAAPDDLRIGAFSNDAPWLVAPESMPWRRSVPTLRAVNARKLPRLTTPRRVPPVLRGARVLGSISTAVGLWAITGRRRGGSRSKDDLSRRLRRSAERLGPTFIKLGQILSSGDGLFPAELVDEFKKCRDQVPAERFDTVRRVVEADLGRPIEDVFTSFDTEPLAAASIAQVHRARLRAADGSEGASVVVKVQRPDVGRLVHQDLAVLAWLAPHLVGRIPVAALANPPALVEVFAHTISEELDFRVEAENMLDIARTLVDLDQSAIVVPRPHPELVTRRVLVMEELAGFRFDDIDGITAAGIDTHRIIRTGMIGFMEGALIHGVFHGDLHGGNLFVLPDGRTALLDYGITGRLTEARRVAFLRLMIGATSSDVRSQVEALRDLGALPVDTDVDDVIRELRLDEAPLDPTTLSQEEMIDELQRVVKALLGMGARMPKELMLFVKNMVFLDGAIAALAPELDLLAEITDVSLHFATVHGERLAAQVGLTDGDYEIDLDSFKDALGVDRAEEQFTYADLRRRRELIRDRLRS